MKKILKDLKKYMCLPKGWKGAYSIGLTEKSYNDAVKFLNLLPQDFPLPETVLAPSGEVSFYWKKTEYFVEAVFPGNAKYHYFFDSENEVNGEDFVPIHTLPQYLVQKVKTHF